MMENPRSKKKQTKKELNHSAIKDRRNLFEIVKETKAIKDKMLRDIKNHFEHEEGHYYKPIRLNKELQE